MAKTAVLPTVLFVVLALAMARASEAQPSLGSLFGVVVDDQGAAISGATVTLTGGPGGPAVQVNNAQGEFKFLALTPGAYTVEVERPGFQTVTYPNLVVSAARNTVIEITLHAAASQPLVLSAGAPVLVDPRLKSGTTVVFNGSGGNDSILQSLPGSSGQRLRLLCDDGNDLITIPAQAGSEYSARSLYPVTGGLGFGFDRVDGSGKTFIHFGSASNGCGLRSQTYSREGFHLEVFPLRDAALSLGKPLAEFLSMYARHAAGGGADIRAVRFGANGAGSFTFSPDFRLSNTVGGDYNFGPQFDYNTVVDRIVMAHTVCEEADDGCQRVRASQLDPLTLAVVPNTTFDLLVNPPFQFLAFGTNVASAPNGANLLVYTTLDPIAGKTVVGAWPFSASGQPSSVGVGNLFGSITASVIGDRNSIRAGADHWTIVAERFAGGEFNTFATTLPIQEPQVPGPPLPIGLTSDDFLDPHLRPSLDHHFTVKPSSQASPAAAAGGAYRQRLKAAQICKPSATTLCLGAGRFQVRATHATSLAAIGAGSGYMLSNDTGYFTFFNAANVELLVKVIDGCGLGGNYWVFAGGLTDVKTVATVTDMTTGQMVTLVNPKSTPFKPYQNTAAFACGSGPSARARRAVAPAAIPAARPPAPVKGDQAACVADATHLCLNGGRFEVGTVWTTDTGLTGAGTAVALPVPGGGAPDTGYFWFFNDANVETVVKVLNGCGLNNRYWVFAGGLTNVEVVTTVRDTQTGNVRTYTNPQNQPFHPVQDTSALATCP